MNFSIGTLILLLYLENTKSSSEAGTFTANLSKISATVQPTSTLFVKSTLRTSSSQSKKPPSTSILSIRFKPNKWKIGRVTNKQYGIINILWQKTKIFIEQDYSNFTCKATTTEMISDNQKQISLETEVTKSPLQAKVQTSTTSYIEFYYLYEADDRIKRKHPIEANLKKVKKNNRTTERSHNKKTASPALFKIHINTIRRQHTPRQTSSAQKPGQVNFYQNKLNKSKQTTFFPKTPLIFTANAKVVNNRQTKKTKTKQPIKFLTKTTLANTKTKRNERKEFKSKSNSYPEEVNIGTVSNIKRLLVPTRTSIAYDKVKFFELYDSNTRKCQNSIHNTFKDLIYSNTVKEVNYHDNEQIRLHDVNENIGHQRNKNITRFVKKHIQDLYRIENKSKNEINISEYIDGHDGIIQLNNTKIHITTEKNTHSSRPATWSEYPFVAVYIYEPLQVHCDAASISPHWLLAAASCLSRHRMEFRGGGLSAFVTFCGDSWRYPRMVSYVRRTLIHPLYHPTDNLRHLYNAGLIQVVNSMADTCNGWAPVSLMSHQFIGDEKNSIGTALGWGLDRYDDTFSVSGIPNHPLMIYEGPVYSQTCPGSSEYSKVRSLEESGTRNVYCLSLPPYLAEENDTVHGALLLIGGKLLALYLKEERRPWGAQSAQYAGTWRLLPWLAETAREPDESFQFDL